MMVLTEEQLQIQQLQDRIKELEAELNKYKKFVADTSQGILDGYFALERLDKGE